MAGHPSEFADDMARETPTYYVSAHPMSGFDKTRSIVSLILLTIGCGLWMHSIRQATPASDEGVLLIFLSLCIGPAKKPGRIYYRPLRWADTLWLMPVFTVVAIVITLIAQRSPASEAHFARIIRHPGVVVPYWALAVWMQCRLWIRAHQESNAPTRVS
jgi:hypothetical protein